MYDGINRVCSMGMTFDRGVSRYIATHARGTRSGSTTSAFTASAVPHRNEHANSVPLLHTDLIYVLYVHQLHAT